MGIVLDQFAAECRSILNKDSGAGGLREICGSLEKVLVNDEFIQEHFPPDNNSPRTILYEDPDLGFCIVAHVHNESSASLPHDHGPSWAIYGQIKGVTEMTEYTLVEKAKDGQPGKVKKIKSYDLKPGMAIAYGVGIFHSPRRDGKTGLVRIEGANLDTIKRDKYELA
jgi:predicted metal-dependent enzyme (double-stranded beta helix superfamily)